MALPSITTSEQLKALDRCDPLFQEVSRSILSRIGITPAVIVAMQSGSCPVTISDERYVTKFFAPLFFDETKRESDALTFLSQLPGYAPTLITTGELDGWGYVVMERLAGKSLRDWWPTLSQSERQKACFETGVRLRHIHQLPLSPDYLAQENWSSFLNQQRSNCLTRHSQLGLRRDLLDQIEPFLKTVDLTISANSCFLHTEVMRDHVFFERIDYRLSFTGFIDFEPSMIGAAEYDFASVGLFLSSGDRAVFRAFCEGYGMLNSVDSAFQKRIMAYTLLHRYSNLNWYLEFMPDASSFEELSELWWAV